MNQTRHLRGWSERIAENRTGAQGLCDPELFPDEGEENRRRRNVSLVKLGQGGERARVARRRPADRHGGRAAEAVQAVSLLAVKVHPSKDWARPVINANRD